MYIKSTSFLPNQVLQINKLPTYARIIESGNSGFIGSQTFINEWVVRISTGELPLVLAGREYVPCKNLLDNSSNNKTGLSKHAPFAIKSCFEAHAEDPTLTTIYVNENKTMLLISYYTD
jgi:hypothetical protein